MKFQCVIRLDTDDTKRSLAMFASNGLLISLVNIAAAKRHTAFAPFVKLSLDDNNANALKDGNSALVVESTRTSSGKQVL